MVASPVRARIEGYPRRSAKVPGTATCGSAQSSRSRSTLHPGGTGDRSVPLGPPLRPNHPGSDRSEIQGFWRSSAGATRGRAWHARQRGDPHQFRDRPGAQALHDMSAVGFHRARADADGPPDLLVGVAGQKALQDLALADWHLGDVPPGPICLLVLLVCQEMSAAADARAVSSSSGL